jgi:hypothetical protein
VFIETGRKFNPKESPSSKLVPEAFETRANIAGRINFISVMYFFLLPQICKGQLIMAKTITIQYNSVRINLLVNLTVQTPVIKFTRVKKRSKIYTRKIKTRQFLLHEYY